MDFPCIIRGLQSEYSGKPIIRFIDEGGRQFDLREDQLDHFCQLNGLEIVTALEGEYLRRKPSN